MRQALLVTAALALASACGGDDGVLLVDLRTDLVPGVDFADIETRIGTRAPVLSSAATGASFSEGRRVAEASDLADGTHQVVVVLYTPSGGVLASRRTDITVDGTTALLVTITRGCIGLDDCTWTGGDAGVPDDANVQLDAGRADAAVSDSGTDGDTGSIPDTGPRDVASADACVPHGEVCNGRDDDCDGDIDEVTSGAAACGCSVLNRAGRAYGFCAAPADWSDAAAECASVGYHLVTIDDAAENVWLADIIAMLGWGPMFIGLNDLSVEGDFVWQDGSSTYRRWAAGQPDDSGGQDCVTLEPSGEWHDRGCLTDYPFICESP